jgi:hypothetical protein
MFKNKPNWDDLPAKAKFIAMDEDGTWRWFTTKPIPFLKFGHWDRATEGETLFNWNPKPNENWVKSLEKRPNEY